MRNSQPFSSGVKRRLLPVRSGVILLVLLFLLSLWPSAAQAQTASPVEILVHLSNAAAAQQIASAMQVQVRDIGLTELGIYGVYVPSGGVDSTIQALKNSAWVLEAEPNYPVQALDVIPDDPAFPNQYALMAIRAPQGWAVEKGSRNIRIAILDSGVDFNHPDLAGKLLPGFDFVNLDSDPQDDYGHGTAVAGVAAASTDNGVGMAGVGWLVKILPIKVLDANGNGTYADVAAGIVWASSQGVQVINLSLGGTNPSFTLEDAVNFAVSKGILLVAASGNTGSEGVLYPARYPQVIAVAATDRNNDHPSFSTYGPEVDVAAPGVQVYTTALGGGYSQRNGTSFAAPHISGLAALLFSMPGKVTAGQVRAAIESTALDLGEPGRDPYTGAGLIQMDAAMRMIPPPPIVSSLPLTSLIPTLFSPSLEVPVALPDASGEVDVSSLSRSVPSSSAPQAGNLPLPVQEVSGQEVSAGTQPEVASTDSALTWAGLGLVLAGIGLAVFGSKLRRRLLGGGDRLR
jgi:thermitase